MYTCSNLQSKQFLLLIDVPIQNQSQELSIYKIFTLDIPHGNFTVHYDTNTQYLRITQDETMAVEISTQQFRICQEANGQFCTVSTPYQLLANPPSCITALYVKNTASISARCSLQIRKTSDVSMPSQLMPNVWILTTAPTTVTSKITLICLGEATQFIEVRKPIHVLHLPTACSATSPNFHLPPHYKSQPLEVNISLDMANLNMINILSLNFWVWQHLNKHQNESQLQHLASIPCSSSGTTLQAHGHWHSTCYTFFIYRANKWYRFNLDTVFTYKSLCNGYRITDTSRFGTILLLFLLVSSFQISMPTFTTRYHAIYHCGWWYRGSTHLQMQWQDLTA